jgi:hypothetical protein
MTVHEYKTMDEDKLRSALDVIATDAELPTTVDIAAARRRGRRRLLARRVAAPLAAALALVVIVTVPYAISSLQPERNRAVSSPGPASPPTRFDPLVPYADFGWLPAGFTESVEPESLSVTSYSSTVQVTRTASASGGRLLKLQVYALDACQVTNSISADVALGEAGKCSIDVSGSTAVTVSGRPARAYRQGGIAWEYAPGAWASLVSVELPSGGPAPHALPAAQMRTVAARVTFGQRQPLAFAYRISGVPAGWQVQGVAFQVSGEVLAGNVLLRIGPASDPSALELATWWPASAATPGSSKNGPDPKYTHTSVSQYGVTWDYMTGPDGGKRSQSISTNGSAVTTGLRVWIAVHVPSPLGDPFAVYRQMTLLGTSPAGWTTRPLDA